MLLFPLYHKFPSLAGIVFIDFRGLSVAGVGIHPCVSRDIAPMDNSHMARHSARMPHDHEHPHSLLPSDPALRVKALETLLTRKGLIDPAALDEIIDTYENKIGPKNGAHVVAKAWRDAEFRKRLLQDPTKTVAELGYYGRQGEHIVVVENTPQVHKMVVCTLCSCYPWTLLGIPPGWYKSDAYRARAVREPRKVLADFGVSLPDETAVRVWDSTAEVRYLVLPMQPKGTDDLDEAALMQLVTRDSMIGTGLVNHP